MTTFTRDRGHGAGAARGRALSLLALCAALGACGFDGGGGGPDGGARPGVELTAGEGAIRLRAGGSAVVLVTLERTGGWEGDLVLEASGLPGGVVANPVTLPAGTSEAVITLNATASAQQGGPLSIALRARSPEDESIAAELERPLYVVGAPGSIDPTFGEEGVTSLPIAPESDTFVLDFLAVDGEGRLSAGGSLQFLDGQPEVALARLAASGQPDPAFGDAGALRTTFGADLPRLLGLVPSEDGGVVVSAWTHTGDVTSGFLRRYTAEGLVDSSFGDAGDVSLPEAGVLAARGDELVVAGAESVIVVDAGGTIDTSFEGTSPLPAYPDSIAFDSEGGILLGVGTDQAQVARLLTSGEPDSAFGSGGVQTFPAMGTPQFAVVRAIAPRADGGLVFGDQELINPFRYTAHVFRYTASGELDQSFGDGGVLVLGDSDMQVRPYDGAIDAEGRVLVLGVSPGAGVLLWRFLPGGQPDLDFGDDGVATVKSPGSGARMVYEPGAERVVACTGGSAGTLTCTRLWL